MKVENKGTYKVITPAAGMWLTDGESVSDSVFMPVGADESKWREITTAEKESIEAHEEPVIETLDLGDDDYALMEAQNAAKIAELKAGLSGYLYDVIAKINGKETEGWSKAVAIVNEIDELGKVVQTTEGNGTMEDPIKGWSVGMDVEQGKWYLTADGYLWEAIKSGKPASTTDREYFDVVGL